MQRARLRICKAAFDVRRVRLSRSDFCKGRAIAFAFKDFGFRKDITLTALQRADNVLS